MTEFLPCSMNPNECKVVQINGQRKYGPPPDWTGPPPPKGCEVFIGKLPRYIFEVELLSLFKNAGRIYEFRLMMDFSGSTRGFAFATYASKSEAERAIKMFNEFEIRPNHRIGVKKSVDNCKLYIGGLPTSKQREDIFNEISKYTAGVVNVVVYSCAHNKDKNRGFAFVEYESHRAASIARRILVSGNVLPFGRSLTVDWSDPEPEIDEEKMKSVATLYVRNIPDYIKEEQLSNLFSLNGTLAIKKVKKLNNFAFVHFYTRSDAELALEKINGFNIDGCIFEVTWAKPVLQDNKKRKSESVVHLKETISGSPVHNKFISAGESHLPKSPIQLLSQICFENGWGKPVFRILPVETASNQDGAIFVSLVVIPNYPHPVKHFISNTMFLSPIEAKRHAAEIALRNIKCLGDRTGRHIIPLEEMPVTHEDNLVGRGVPLSRSYHESNDSFCCNIYQNSVTEILPYGDPLNLLSMAISLAKFELQTKVCSVPNQTKELL